MGKNDNSSLWENSQDHPQFKDQFKVELISRTASPIMQQVSSMLQGNEISWPHRFDQDSLMYFFFFCKVLGI